MLSHWYEEIEELREKIAKTRQRISEELHELKGQGRDIDDPVFQSTRQYLDKIEDIETEVTGGMENLVQWAKLKLTESRIYYERGKRGLKRGELYQL